MGHGSLGRYRSDHGGLVRCPGGLGVFYIVQEPSILLGLSLYYGVHVLINGLVGFAIMSSVFLVVTGGAEALYADIGHFG